MKQDVIPTKRIYLSPPHMSGHERQALLEAFDSGWVAPVGPDLNTFERQFADYVGTRHAVAVSSGTAALHLALGAIGVEPGDQVLTSTLTFVATANAIRYTGAEPVFIDSDRLSWNLDPILLSQELEARRSSGQKIAAVVSVDVFGQCADYDPIRRACEQFEVPLIEDAAEALGARYREVSAGTFGEIGCFSFNGNKIITTSGGGMVVTNDAKHAERIRHRATQAREPAVHYEHVELGYNYRMSNLLAAIGSQQLGRLDGFVERRRQIFAHYQSAFADLDGIEFMPEPDWSFSTRWLTCVLIDSAKFGASRDQIIAALAADQIESRPVWKPMHLQPLYRSSEVRGGSVAESLFQNGLCLPSGSSLSDDDLQRIIAIVRRTAGASN